VQVEDSATSCPLVHNPPTCVSNFVWPRSLKNEATYARIELLRHSGQKQHLIQQVTASRVDLVTKLATAPLLYGVGVRKMSSAVIKVFTYYLLRYSFYSFLLRGWVDSRAIVRSEGFYVNVKSTDTSWDRTSDLSIFITARLDAGTYCK